MPKKQTIAVYIPQWLAHIDTGLVQFTNGLYSTIEQSEKYNLLKITPRMCKFKSIKEARAFVQKNNIAFVMYHATRGTPQNQTYEKGIDLLEQCVPFLNPKSVHIADDKLETKQILRKNGIPVLSDRTIRNRAELFNELHNGEIYVVKPHNSESGNGVKLIQLINNQLYEYQDRLWKKIRATNTKNGIILLSAFGPRQAITVSFFIAAFICLVFGISASIVNLFLCLGTLGLLFNFQKMVKQNFVYSPLMLEPFFGDSMDEFYCLRCTVIDGKVVESAKKANTNNVTPNISHGGKATNIALSTEQEALAIAAANAVGAKYAGIDLLHANGQTIVCEINVGPIGVYCEQTGVDVGSLLAKYAIEQCDIRASQVSF